MGYFIFSGNQGSNRSKYSILLLWLSISYGFTNFSWIWLWLDRDRHALEWSILYIMGWLSTALLSQNFGDSIPGDINTEGNNKLSWGNGTS